MAAAANAFAALTRSEVKSRGTASGQPGWRVKFSWQFSEGISVYAHIGRNNGFKSTYVFQGVRRSWREQQNYAEPGRSRGHFASNSLWACSQGSGLTRAWSLTAGESEVTTGAGPRGSRCSSANSHAAAVLSSPAIVSVRSITRTRRARPWSSARSWERTQTGKLRRW